MTTSAQIGPLVGVATFLVNEHGQFLIGHRLSKHAQGTWCLTGGHVEWGEEPAVAAARETLEEVGLDLPVPTFVDMTNDIFEGSGKHYITLLFAVSCPSDAPVRVMEPHKCSEWKWVSPDALPAPLIKGLETMSHRHGAAGLAALLSPYRAQAEKAA